jgi:hypothetical protein
MSQPPSSDLKRSSDEPPMGEPSPKRTLETTLESVPNDLDDVTHARLDEEVRNRAIYEPSKGPEAQLLLMHSIISFSEGLLDPKHKDVIEALRLFKKHPELRDKLHEAWTAKSFKEIRNLGTCITLLPPPRPWRSLFK